MLDFQFHRLDARPFVTVDVSICPGDADPTGAALKAIDANDVAGAIVRVRLSLPGDAVPRVRETEIREALHSAHYIAAITRESTDSARRTRLDPELARDMEPMQALRMYLENRDIEPQRRERVLRSAEELVREELAGPE